MEKYMSVRRDSVIAAEAFVRLARDPASGKWMVTEGCGAAIPVVILPPTPSPDAPKEKARIIDPKSQL